jgi:prevent-host-death family protein
MRTWQLQRARSHLKDLVDDALHKGPQRVTRHGKRAVVVVAEEEWKRVKGKRLSFGELLVVCPLRPGDLPRRRRARAIRRRFFD